MNSKDCKHNKDALTNTLQRSTVWKFFVASNESCFLTCQIFSSHNKFLKAYEKVTEISLNSQVQVLRNRKRIYYNSVLMSHTLPRNGNVKINSTDPDYSSKYLLIVHQQSSSGTAKPAR